MKFPGLTQEGLAEECVFCCEDTGQLWVAYGHGRGNDVGAAGHLVDFTDSQESHKVYVTGTGQECRRGWGRSQGVGCSSLHLLVWVWQPPDVASFWAAHILGEFQVKWEESFKASRLPEVAVLQKFSLGSCQSSRSSESHPLLSEGISRKLPLRCLDIKPRGGVAGGGPA